MALPEGSPTNSQKGFPGGKGGASHWSGGWSRAAPFLSSEGNSWEPTLIGTQPQVLP